MRPKDIHLWDKHITDRERSTDNYIVPVAECGIYLLLSVIIEEKLVFQMIVYEAL